MDHPEDACRREERRIPVDDKDLASAKLALRDLPQRVGGAFRIALVDELDPPVEMRRDVGVMRVRDHLDVLVTGDAGLADRLEDPIDHRTAADRMEDFGNPRSHSGAVAGGEYDRNQGGAQLVPIMACPSGAFGATSR